MPSDRDRLTCGMLSSQPQGRGVSPPVREFGVPTVCAACAVIAGATVALQASGGMRGNVTVIAVEVGAVVALTGFLAWRFLGGSASGADKDMQCEPAKLKDADAVKPQPDNGCCKGACGFACEGEAEEKEVGEADISGTDLEDLRSSDDDMKRAARVTGLYTYIQPSTTRRRTTKQMDSEGNQTSDRDNSTTATTPPSSATHAVEGAFLPGRAKIFFKTFGCSHNISDSEYMRRYSLCSLSLLVQCLWPPSRVELWMRLRGLVLPTDITEAALLGMWSVLYTFPYAI